MKRFYFLRMTSLLASFVLSLFSVTANAPWNIVASLAAAAALLFGLLYELYIRYTTGEEQKVRVTSRELMAFGIGFFVISIAMRWLFEKTIAPTNLYSTIALNNLYSTVGLLGRTVTYIYVYYLFRTYFESRKNQTQGKQ